VRDDKLLNWTRSSDEHFVLKDVYQLWEQTVLSKRELLLHLFLLDVRLCRLPLQ